MKYKIFSFFIGLTFIGQLAAQDTSKVNNHNYTVAEKNIIDLTQQIVPGRKNSPAQQVKPYIILISADGFRADFAEKYEAKNLQIIIVLLLDCIHLITGWWTIVI
jgi:hypothetical protein